MGIMDYEEALDILVNAKYCRNTEHEKQINEAIEVLQDLIDDYYELVWDVMERCDD